MGSLSVDWATLGRIRAWEAIPSPGDLDRARRVATLAPQGAQNRHSQAAWKHASVRLPGVTSGKPVSSLAVVSMKGVDGAGLGQPAKLAVDGRDPHPQTPRSQIGAEKIANLRRAEEPVGTLQNF